MFTVLKNVVLVPTHHAFQVDYSILRTYSGQEQIWFICRYNPYKCSMNEKAVNSRSRFYQPKH